MLSEKDIICIHQTTKDFSIWYKQSIEALTKFLNRDIAKNLIQYAMLEAIDEIVIKDEVEIESAKLTMLELYDAIFESVSECDYKECVNSFVKSTKEYYEFMEKYRLDRSVSIKSTGTYWLKLVDSLEGNADKYLEMINELVPFVTWVWTYSFEYAIQYVIDNPCNVTINNRIYKPCNYWELKDLEDYYDNYPNKKEQTDYPYNDREELLLDIVRHGMFLPQAIIVTRRIRRGQRLTEEQSQHLVDCGMTNVEQICSTRYLQSISGIFYNVFRVNKLI